MSVLEGSDDVSQENLVPTVVAVGASVLGLVLEVVEDLGGSK